MKLLPDGPADIETLMCDQTKMLATYQTWNFRIRTDCEAHYHPISYVMIRWCARCGTWTELVIVKDIPGEEGGEFEFVLTANEVNKYFDGDPELPF